MDQEKVGKIIKEIRVQNHLTQKEFATKYGVTYQAVSKWENGKNMPDIALMKQICDDFHIEITGLLEGKNEKKKKYWLILVGLLVFLLVCFLLFLFIRPKEDDFTFKMITSNCGDFKITGSLAYNDTKASIYISNVLYCGKEEATSYERIEVDLYEKYDSLETKIDHVLYQGEPVLLEDFLNEITFHIDNYTRLCAEFSDDTLYMLIKATNKENQVITYEIPLSIQDNCK